MHQLYKKALVSLLSALSIMLLVGCGADKTQQTTGKDDMKPSTGNQAMAQSGDRWSGVVEQGVECPRLRLADGAVFSLMGLPPAFSAAGTSIVVTGEIAARSTCQQGKTIRVTGVIQN